jgi:hypothetical protein
MQIDKFEEAIALFDAYNKKDPNKIIREGETFPAEYFYALQLHNWIKKLEVSPSEALLLASRCQHIGRWEVPRESYPEGKAGYLNWRSNLAKYHAEKAEEMLRKAGYEEALIEHVKRIVLKKQIKADEEVQAIENALCLVFLEFQLNEFIEEHDDAKVIRILQKSWGKMSEKGHQAALQLSFTGRGKELIERALA